MWQSLLRFKKPMKIVKEFCIFGTRLTFWLIYFYLKNAQVYSFWIWFTSGWFHEWYDIHWIFPGLFDCGSNSMGRWKYRFRLAVLLLRPVPIWLIGALVIAIRQMLKRATAFEDNYLQWPKTSWYYCPCWWYNVSDT